MAVFMPLLFLLKFLALLSLSLSFSLLELALVLVSRPGGQDG
jgi:hypothetical protein